MSNELLSPTKAAEIANCHHDTVRRAIESGYLPAQRVGRTWAIKLSDLQMWIGAGKPNHRRKSSKKKSSTQDTDETGES
ncbi:MAG: excisionase family DNA-binding protein [Anaerolinea sp.]|nr:excisionase family DNA-binding protein [Anaerolinea sp.]